MKEIPLKFEELSLNMRVEDWWTELGTVIECDDIHNVLIQFDNGGSSLYCLADDCVDKDPTPLYKPKQL